MAREAWLLERAAAGEVSLFLTSWRGPVVVLGYAQKPDEADLEWCCTKGIPEAGVDCGTELPDHLPNVLRLVARWQDPEIVAEFVEEILHPALRMMIEEFGPSRMQERNRLYKKHFKTLIASSDERGTIFRTPLEALVAVLEEDFSFSPREIPESASDFLRSVGRELEIEASEGRPSKSGSMT